MKNVFFFLFACFILTLSASPSTVEMQKKNHGHGNDHVYFEPPTVTYDDDLNELHVYFGSTSTINIEYTDPTGTPYYYVYGESHAGYTATTYYSLPTGYYTITIHSIYGITYTGNFSVS